MDTETPTAGYVKGFNEGYTITEHLPDLAEQLAKIGTTNERMQGFRDGRKIYVLELLKGDRPKWMDAEKGHEPDTPAQEKGKGIDKD